MPERDPSIARILAELDWLHRVAARGGHDLHAAEDDVQEALVRALRARPRATSGPQLRAWLRSVVRSVTRERLRGEARRRQREELCARTEEPLHGQAEEALDLESVVLRLRGAIQRVREPYGSAVRLRYLEGLSAEEAARRLRISDEALRQRTSRGLRLLRVELEVERRPRRRVPSLVLLPWRRLQHAIRRRVRPLMSPLSVSAVAALAVVTALLVPRDPAAQARERPAVRVARAEAGVRAGPELREPAIPADAPPPLAPFDPASPRAEDRDREILVVDASTLPLRPGDHFGRSVAWLGDLDGDGAEEIAVGADGGGMPGGHRGAVLVLSLREEGVDLRERIECPPSPHATDDMRELFGYRLAALGDLEGDGLFELAASAPRAATISGPPPPHWVPFTGDGITWILSLDRAGRVRRIVELSARSAGLAAELTPACTFGSALAPVGDVDGDGIRDLAAGADQTPGGGAVWILFLRADGAVRHAQEIGHLRGGFAGRLQEGDKFGFSVAALGDLDGDGVPDLAVGAPNAFDGVGRRGAVWILFLRRDGNVLLERRFGHPEVAFAGMEPMDGFGTDVDSRGDVDGDGTVEILVSGCRCGLISLTRDGHVHATGRQGFPGQTVRFVELSPDRRTMRVLHGNAGWDDGVGRIVFREMPFELVTQPGR